MTETETIFGLPARLEGKVLTFEVHPPTPEAVVTKAVAACVRCDRQFQFLVMNVHFDLPHEFSDTKWLIDAGQGWICAWCPSCRQKVGK